MSDYIAVIIEYLGHMVEKYGLLGIGAAMFTESVGVPFASTVVFVSAGGLINSGKISFWALFAASTTGITLGSIAGYLLGYISRAMGRVIKLTFGNRWISRHSPENNGKSGILKFMERYGNYSIFLAQLFGITRTFISIPAGIMGMNLLLFTVYTALGGALFSLGSIGLSILLTGILKIFYRYLRIFMTLPTPVWVLSGALIALMIWSYRRLGWKIRLNKFIVWGKTWLERIK